MKVCQPRWINHDGMPICAIDIHPDGSRVATGGQIEGSGRIVIWNMAPVISEDAEKNENVPRILSQLDNHLACVNCLRWNCSGKFLASGGDDKLIMIWTISKTGGIGGLGAQSCVEPWRCVATLRGHHGDVLDMAWAPHDTWLATCSIDNTIIVWRTDTNPPVQLTVLRGHTGLVKGVAWDPVGKYLSSQSDDKSVIVWRTSDWLRETTVTEPFTNCSGTTMMLRLSWSPDGQYLVTTHAMNGRVPTAQIIDRDGWTHDTDFVGHRMAVTCVRFSNYIMETTRKGKMSRACCCALGSRDRSLSVWITCLNRPLVVIENLFKSPVNDVSWGPGGLALMACSGDGSVAYLEFSKDEVGTPISQSDKEQLFKKLYGRTSMCEMDGNLVLESAGLLQAREEQQITTPPKAAPPPVVSTPAPVPNTLTPRPPSTTPAQYTSPFSQNSMSNSASRPGQPMQLKQIETRRADGKRRIKPVFISHPSSDFIGDEVAPFCGDTNSSPFSLSVTIQSRNTREAAGTAPPDDSNQSNLATPLPSQPHVVSPVVGQNSTAVPTVPVKLPVSSVGGFSTLLNSTEKKDTLKRKASEQAAEAPGAKVTRLTSLITVEKKPQALPALKPPSTQVINSRIQFGDDWVQIENDKNKKGSGPAALLHCMSVSQQKSKWTLAVGSEVGGACCVRGLVVAGCVDGSLLVVRSSDGVPASPPLVLGAAPALLAAAPSGYSVVCATCDASLYSWKVSSHLGEPVLIPVLSAVSIAPLINSQDGEVIIKECFPNEEGEPLLAMSNGKSYMYSLPSRMWLLVGNSTDPTWLCSLNSFRNGPRAGTLNSTPLRMLQTAALSSCRRGLAGSGGMVSGEVSALCTRAFLERQISSCLALRSPVEYKLWLLTLVRFLLDQGLLERLRGVCEELLGPAHSSPRLSSWQSSILGVSKHALLSDVLNEMSSNLRVQRLYLEFKNLLDRTQQRAPQQVNCKLESVSLPPHQFH